MDTESRNYYELLGVTRDASLERIKEAYKDIAKVYHPDSNFYDEIMPGKADGSDAQTFKALTAAYTTLIHPDKRRAYDDTLPPILPGWEDDDDVDTVTATVVRPLHMQKPNARRASFGVFGVVPDDEPPNSQVEPRNQSSTGILGKIFGIFGKK